ncbi:MAG TPA: hypothetical protein VLW54_05345 [Candidatus Acidoferrales bacterium]|nr:hypothetical protein [Candidatus Acidoferrales bacterium]
MNAVRERLRSAGRRLLGSPTAMFVAVLTVGLGATSTAEHLGLVCARGASARHANVVLACPRTGGAHNSPARANSGAKTVKNSPATATESPAAAATNSGTGTAGQTAWLEKDASKKPGDGGLTVPLPDFSAPQLSRFISPL